MGSSINLSDIGVKLEQKDAEFERDNVADLLGRQTKSFPGAQPVSFSRHHLDELRHVDYYMCEKTDGIRCLLFMTQYLSTEGTVTESQLLIDRRNDYYHIPTDSLHIPRNMEDITSFHIGTLLDGELVLDCLPNGHKKLVYYIFDILALDGENLMSRPLDKRYARLQEFVWKPAHEFAKRYPEDVASQPFQLQLKQMEMPYGAMMMFKDKIPNLPHGNDGLIFTCVSTPYVAGTDQHILKWKPPQENTIDFRLTLRDFPMEEDEDGPYEDWDAKPEMELQVNHGREYQYFAMLTITDTEWEAMKRMNQVLDGRIIECYRDPFSGQWRPKVEHDTGFPRFRDDKQDANHISVVHSVLESIKDAVTEQELIGCAADIRTAFKDRAERKKAEAAKMAQMQEARRRESMDVKAEPPPDVGPKYED